ncbi:MAG TPA: sialidase family protein, partial [Thermoplasmata archaeon]|nr:sialidase family protein [Thermoplasmata archaeon]
MTGRIAASAGRRTAPWVLLLLVAGLVTSYLPAVGASAAPALPVGHSGTLAVTAPASALRATSPVLAPRPAASLNGTIGPVYSSTSLPPAVAPNVPCYWQNYTYDDYHYCYPQTQNPSIVTLANGDLGLAYSIYTKTGPACNATGGSNLTSWTATNIAWSVSPTNGSTWGPSTIIGNVSCRYPSSTEPAFATGGPSSVYGVFVASNQTTNGTAKQPLFPPDWGDTANDTLIFLNSANNGSTWSSPVSIPGVQGVARPQMAVFGSTVYVVYIHVPVNSSGTSVYPVGTQTSGFPGAPIYSPAISVQLIYSANGGSTWNGPYTLPGMNASFGNWSTAPSIAVNANGTVGVAYGTNRSCVYQCGSLPGVIPDYAEDIVVGMSSTNGSTWGAPTTAATKAAELFDVLNYQDQYVQSYGSFGPELTYAWESNLGTSIAFGAGSSIYVAYVGASYEG